MALITLPSVREGKTIEEKVAALNDAYSMLKKQLIFLLGALDNDNIPELVAKIDELTMKAKLEDVNFGISIPKENIGILGSENIDYASITTAVVENLVVDTANIKDLAVTSAKIANATITSAQIANATITNAQIANATITAANIQNATITFAQIASATIQAANIANATITFAQIANATIKTANIESGAITTALIATGAIETAQIADASITDAKIVELTANKITAGTLSVERLIVRDPVTPANSLIYAINNITGALQTVQGDTLNGEILTPRTITADRIVVGAITANEIAAHTITANEIAVNSITAASGIIADIDASKITSGSISADRISGGTITGVTINVATDATVGNNLYVGTVSIRDIGSQMGFYVGGSLFMKFYSNTLSITGGVTTTGDLYAPNSAVRGNTLAISTTGSFGGNVTCGGLDCNGTAYMDYATVYGSFSAGGSISHTGTTLGFFSHGAASKRAVASLATAHVSTAPATWTSNSWGETVHTDIDLLWTKVNDIITSLQQYGLL